MIKDLAEGFGREEDIVSKNEINLRVFLNCYITLAVIQAGIMIW